MPGEHRYLDNTYALENPEWHAGDAAWKVKHIRNILISNGVEPDSICDVGCGSGAVVEILSGFYPHARIDGYEISPYAFALAQKRQTANLTFTLGSPFQTEKSFGLCLAMDVIEHVENPFDFLRSMTRLAQWHLFHIPLDMNALSVGRGWILMDVRRKVGHLHYFTRDTAIAMLEESGLEIVDTAYTPWAIDQSYKTWKKRLAAWPRRIAFHYAPDLTVRSVGGWSLMVLARNASR